MIALAISISLFSCHPNNIENEDDNWGKFFTENHVKGTFALYDNGHGTFSISNLSWYKDSAFLPASTFKIVNSLIGIETGIINNENMIIKWDGIKRRPEWDKDLTMKEAFAVSAVPYYQEVARRIGQDTMQHWLDTLHYGTTKITGKIDSFWLDNSLKITPDEQLGLAMALYFDKLPFQKRTMNIVKSVMLRESNTAYNLSYKTGLGYAPNGNAIGWVLGWIEENKHPYFFVLNIEGDHNMDPDIRIKMLKKILNTKSLLGGKQ
ncbi:MAG: class D beta-lactamase [Pseudopedobacter saltans]|uniref:Beta-lactamase n=1 Tax=Pseudopedobacter saltans TaxID=151895 RepID=A0A2W5EXX3_9SPHI|nr:MAG: class D beta-lactamase [Pseudopedobacter saltans]